MRTSRTDEMSGLDVVTNTLAGQLTTTATRVYEGFQRNHAVLDAAAGRGQENPVTSSTLRDSGGGVGSAAASNRVKDPRQLLEAIRQVPLERITSISLSF